MASKKEEPRACINHADRPALFDGLCRDCVKHFADQGSAKYKNFLEEEAKQVAELTRKKKAKKAPVAGDDLYEGIANAVEKKIDLWFSGTDDFYWYESKSGLWRPGAEIRIKAFLVDFRRDNMKLDPDSAAKMKITTIQKEVITILKGRLADSIQSMPEPDRRYIPLGNGIYDLEDEQLIPYSRDFFFTTKIPWDYNPSAKCEKFSSMMDDWYTKEKVITGWEIMALCLYRGYPIHKFFVLYSGGGQGKSTYMKVLRHMLGVGNICSIALDKLNDQFTTIELHRKYANLADELSAEKFSNTETLKMATGESLIQARAIYKAPIKFENYATVVFSLNPEDRFPESNDKTRGFYRRLCMIEFKGAVATKAPIIGLAESVIDDSAEMEGVLYKSLQVLKKLRDGGWKMELDEGADETRRKHMAESNPLQVFVNEYCKRGDNKDVDTTEFMQDLNTFLKAIGKKPFSSYGMKNKMEKLEVFKKRESYGQNYRWVGIEVDKLKLKKLVSESEGQKQIEKMGLTALEKVQQIKKTILGLLEKVPSLTADQIMPLCGCDDMDLVVELMEEVNGGKEIQSKNDESAPF